MNTLISSYSLSPRISYISTIITTFIIITIINIPIFSSTFDNTFMTIIWMNNITFSTFSTISSTILTSSTRFITSFNNIIFCVTNIISRKNIINTMIILCCWITTNKFILFFTFTS